MPYRSPHLATGLETLTCSVCSNVGYILPNNFVLVDNEMGRMQKEVVINYILDTLLGFVWRHYGKTEWV
jgi:hypothetical protein